MRIKDIAAEHGGFTLIYRSLRDDPFWKMKPFGKGQAWVDLILLANFKDVKEVEGDHIVVYERGKVYRSMQWLAEEWGWDRRKVKRFLMALESDGKVSVEVSRGGTSSGCVITVENYDKFQIVSDGDGTTDGTTDGTSDGTTDGTQINNDKKRIIKENARACEGETPRGAEERKVIPMPEEIKTKWKDFMEG